MAGPGRLDDGSQTRRGLATLDLEVEALAGVERNVPYGVGPADVPDANLVDTRPDCSCRTGEADDPTRSNPATADGVGARGAGRADEPKPRLPAGDHAAGNERGRRGGGNAERAQGGRGTGRRYAGGIPRLHPDLGAALGEAGFAGRSPAGRDRHSGDRAENAHRGAKAEHGKQDSGRGGRPR